MLRFIFILESNELPQIIKNTDCNLQAINCSKESLTDAMDVCTSPTLNSNDNNNNEAGFESDSISVTGSPNDNSDEENEKQSLSPTPGAFIYLKYL